MTTLRALSAACLIAALSACAGLQNACLPEAAVMQRGLSEKGIPAKVVTYRATSASHAITVYRLGSQVWGWDSCWKSNRLPAGAWNDPLIAAACWVEMTGSGIILDAEEL